MVSRGCPFDCSYCCNHAIRAIYRNKGDIIRCHSVDYCAALINRLLRQFPRTKYCDFYDDMFTLNRDWLDDFLKKFSRSGIAFSCNSRFDVLDEKLVKMLAASGCARVNAAVESGNERIRTEDR